MRPAPGTDLDRDSLVSAVFTLTHLSTGLSVSRSPRRVVPMRKDDLLGVFVEIERVQLAEDHMLLIKDDPRIRAGVDDLLSKVGRRGAAYSADGSNDTIALPGVPEGWLLYDDVQIFATLPVAPALTDLNALVPLASAQLSFGGGLKLPGRVRKWSSLRPPEIRAVVAESAELTLKLVSLDEDSDLELSWESTQPILLAPLDGKGLPDGDYEVLLTAGKKEVAQATLRLRSSDTPDQLAWETATRLTHDLSAGPRNAISASPHENDTPHEVVVDGPWATPLDTEIRSMAVPAQPRWDSAKRSSPAPVVPPIVLGAVDPSSCVVTGAHYIELPTWYGGNPSSALIDGVCKKCGLVRRLPTRPRKRVVAGHTPVASHIDLSVLPPMQGDDVDWDSALDALVHTGGGPISAFERVAMQVEASSLFSDTFLRELEVLAQVDIRRDEKFVPMEWEVPPPYLAGLPDGRHLLAGAWNSFERQRLGYFAAQSGGSLSAARIPNQPTSWFLTGVAQEVLESVPEDTRTWTLVPDAARRMVRVLPPISEVGRALPIVELPQYLRATRFDLDSASWASAMGVVVPGAYRLGQAFRTVDVQVTSELLDLRRGRLGPVQLLKHLAAQADGRLLLAHLPQSQTLIVPLGADLPSLYGRVAVLCSGEAPVANRKLRLLAYKNVPADVAGALSVLFSE